MNCSDEGLALWVGFLEQPFEVDCSKSRIRMTEPKPFLVFTTVEITLYALYKVLDPEKMAEVDIDKYWSTFFDFGDDNPRWYNADGDY